MLALHVWNGKSLVSELCGNHPALCFLYCQSAQAENDIYFSCRWGSGPSRVCLECVCRVWRVTGHVPVVCWSFKADSGEFWCRHLPLDGCTNRGNLVLRPSTDLWWISSACRLEEVTPVWQRLSVSTSPGTHALHADWSSSPGELCHGQSPGSEAPGTPEYGREEPGSNWSLLTQVGVAFYTLSTPVFYSHRLFRLMLDTASCYTAMPEWLTGESLFHDCHHQTKGWSRGSPTLRAQQQQPQQAVGWYGQAA